MMTPSSSSGIESFSFLVPKSLPADMPSNRNQEPDRTRQSPPHSDRLLRSGTTKTAPAPDRLATLPTLLIPLIKSCLTDRDALQLILTNQLLRREVEAIYKLRLRKTVADQAVSPIASCQNSENLLPQYVPMGPVGELTLQKCLSLKASDLSEQEYLDSVVKIIRSYLPTTKADTDQLKDVISGAVLALGGISMQAKTLNALWVGIMGYHDVTSHAQLGAIILGIFTGLGRNIGDGKHHDDMFRRILACHRMVTSEQLGAMGQSVCIIYGGKKMAPQMRTEVLTKILTYFKTSNYPQHIASMIFYMCFALGGAQMAPVHCDGLVQDILDLYGNNKKLPLNAIIIGLCQGLGGTAMPRSKLDAVLTRLLICENSSALLEGLNGVCRSLGGMTMSPGNRDALLANILGVYAAGTPIRMGVMIWEVCRTFGGASLDGGEITITPANLDAIISQIVSSFGTCSAGQIAMMIRRIFVTLGRTSINQERREILASRIRESAHAREITFAIRLTENGQEIVDFLQLETAPD